MGNGWGGGEEVDKKIPYSQKYIERRLSIIGAKVVKATERSYKAQKLCGESSQLLRNAQTEIADLYEALDELVAATAEKESGPKAAENQNPLAGSVNNPSVSHLALDDTA